MDSVWGSGRGGGVDAGSACECRQATGRQDLGYPYLLWVDSAGARRHNGRGIVIAPPNVDLTWPDQPSGRPTHPQCADRQTDQGHQNLGTLGAQDHDGPFSFPASDNPLLQALWLLLPCPPIVGSGTQTSPPTVDAATVRMMRFSSPLSVPLGSRHSVLDFKRQNNLSARYFVFSSLHALASRLDAPCRTGVKWLDRADHGCR